MKATWCRHEHEDDVTDEASDENELPGVELVTGVDVDSLEPIADSKGNKLRGYDALKKYYVLGIRLA